jgi:cell division protein FtsN
MTHRRRGGPSRLGTFFFLVGCLAVLGGTFAAGFLTGRYWSRPAGDRSAAGGADAAKRWAETRATERAASSPDALPKLTFYQELTAPLAPDAGRAGRAGARAGKVADRSPRAVEGQAPAATPAVRGASEAGERFTVQVGAYRARPPAEALRATLAASGHDAYVSESPGAGEARFRVRVGSYPSREVARETAARLSAERPLSAFVTTR